MTPRVVRTVEELEAVPVGTRVQDSKGRACEKKNVATWYVAGLCGVTRNSDFLLPATVLAPLSVTAEQVEGGAE